MSKETRPYVVIVMVGHKPKYYFGWNIDKATHDDMVNICCAQAVAISRIYKQTSAILFKYNHEDNKYHAVHSCNWRDKDWLTVSDSYTPECMAELEQSLINKSK